MNVEVKCKNTHTEVAIIVLSAGFLYIKPQEGARDALVMAYFICRQHEV